MNKNILILLALSLSIKLSAQDKPGYKNKNAPIEDRIKDLVSRMTLDEKILQLYQYTAGYNTNVNNIDNQYLFNIILSNIKKLIQLKATSNINLHTKI